MNHHLLDSLVVECWLRVREVPGSIPSQGPSHTKDVIKIIFSKMAKNGVGGFEYRKLKKILPNCLSTL